MADTKCEPVHRFEPLLERDPATELKGLQEKIPRKLLEVIARFDVDCGTRIGQLNSPFPSKQHQRAIQRRSVCVRLLAVLQRSMQSFGSGAISGFSGGAQVLVHVYESRGFDLARRRSGPDPD